MNSILETNQFDIFGDWIEYLLLHQGVIAPIFLLILEEAGIPLPVPGDIIISFTGYQISQGHIPYAVAFLLLLISVLIGSSILYYISQRFGQKLIRKFGDYIDLNDEKLELVEEKFRKYGPLVIIIGRHIPGFRVPITVFSGLSNVKYQTFILSTLVSIIIWIPLNLSIGERLGPKTVKLLHGHPWTYFLFFIPFIFFLFSITFLHHKKVKNRSNAKLSKRRSNGEKR